ncbi:MAG: PorT family protein [Bacteroidales bacterium]|nr:PorT family protein [Bacteroidales bacterium]MBP5690009.1 PorT family protein [Bacteroidales bacterium]
MKRFFLVVVVALIAISASAQQIGVIAGITGPNSTLKGSDIGAFDQYHVGFVANFPVMEGLRLQPELIYKVKGTSVDQIGSGNDKYDMKVGFIELGLEGQVGIGRDFIRIYGLAEPFIGYNLKDQGWDKEKDPIENLSWDKTEYGIAVGGGVELFQHVQASVKYFWNMGSVKGDVNKIVDGDKLRNFNGITLSVALLF